MPQPPDPSPQSHDEDLPWVRRAQAGDLEAFDTLVARHQSTMTALLYRFAPSRADLEDLVQETFVRAWRSLGDWRAEKPFVHWLKRIAVHAALDFCRRHRRSPFSRLASDDALEAVAASGASSPPGAAREVRWILAQLPPEDGALMTLLYLNDMPLAEAAGHFGWSLANAKIRAFRARRRLKTLLLRHGYTLD
jgi:RNA polymerase sigma-70 factor, ECF subfamily